MADIEIVSETEQANAWAFHVRVFDGGKKHDYRVTLSWVDYDLWCRGRIAPQKVVHGAFLFLLKHEPADAILSSFDCAIIRRYFPQVDHEINKYFP